MGFPVTPQGPIRTPDESYSTEDRGLTTIWATPRCPSREGEDAPTIPVSPTLRASTGGTGRAGREKFQAKSSLSQNGIWHTCYIHMFTHSPNTPPPREPPRGERPKGEGTKENKLLPSFATMAYLGEPPPPYRNNLVKPYLPNLITRN